MGGTGPQMGITGPGQVSLARSEKQGEAGVNDQTERHSGDTLG